MKKTYIQPTTKLHIVGVHQMLCGSPTVNDEGTDAIQLGKEENEDINFGW